MARKYFNIKLEFDKTHVHKTIQETIQRKGKGYVCSIESNNLTVANTNPAFLAVVNEALINICDGSVIAKILGLIHRKALSSYVGADLFMNFVQMHRYRQFFLGNNKEVLSGLKTNLSRIDPSIEQMTFMELPFKDVEQFEYELIADQINKDKPDIIWVSLGAPKQEFFMSYLNPHINQGVMFGFGAIFNFNSGVGKVKRAPKLLRKFYLEWLYRAFNEPKKNVPRYWRFVKILPRLIVNEIGNRKNG